MNLNATHTPTNDPAERQVSGRDVKITAAPRCAAYAAWSELMASPHDLDPRPSLKDKLGVGARLPYETGLDELIQEFIAVDLERLKAQYSGLFEVGNKGPPVPIREELQTGQRAGTRESLIRFDNFFSYSLAEKFAWLPDHLSVELEFMHFLCYREAAVADNAISFQLAQADFTQRHLLRWIGPMVADVETVASGSLYGRIMQGLKIFIDRDFEWQNTTISETGSTVAEEGSKHK